jgi:ribosome-interacting GTPase 1
MPTNLPPEYFEIEKRYRLAKSPGKIACLEEMLSVIPKHKGTDHLRADYRRQISKLKSESQSHKKSGVYQHAFHVEREGAGQAVVLGPANAGKSSLVAALTHASPEVSAAPYTTWKPTPGMLDFEGVQIQLVDTPPLDREYLEPELIDLVRRSDLILLVVDLQTDPERQLEKTVATLEQNHILPAHRKDRYTSGEEVTFIPLLVVANKCDDESLDEIRQVFHEPLAEIADAGGLGRTGRDLEQLKRAVFEQLHLVRIYPGRLAGADFTAPFVMKQGATLEEFAGRIHKDFLELKFARVWAQPLRWSDGPARLCPAGWRHCRAHT